MVSAFTQARIAEIRRHELLKDAAQRRRVAAARAATQNQGLGRTRSYRAVWTTALASGVRFARTAVRVRLARVGAP